MSDSEPRLIRGYLEVLAARLPASIVDELADGLAETHRAYLRRGLSPEAAAEAALAMAGSMARVALCARALRPALAG